MGVKLRVACSSIAHLEGVYTVDRRPNNNYWEAIAIATHACCPDFEKPFLSINNWFVQERKVRKVKGAFRDATFFCTVEG